MNLPVWLRGKKANDIMKEVEDNFDIPQVTKGTGKQIREEKDKEKKEKDNNNQKND